MTTEIEHQGTIAMTNTPPPQDHVTVAEWQRLIPDFGWQRISESDLDHYRNKGSSLRALYEHPAPAPSSRRTANIDQEALAVADDLVRQMMDKGALLAIRDNEGELVPMALDRQFQLKAGWQIAIAAALQPDAVCPDCGAPVTYEPACGFIATCGQRVLTPRPNGCPALSVSSEGDYFGALVARARIAAEKAARKFPQPNYVTLKIAEEAGEVVRGAVHYAEGRMPWDEVEGEIVQLLAMLIRFVTEGDEINGVRPPALAASEASPE